MGSVGFRILPEDRRIWVQRDRRLYSVLSSVSVVTRLVAYFSKSYLAAGIIVSGVASVVAAILLRRLVQLDYPASVAMRSVWFFLIFPTAYFLHVGYGEGLFLALAFACILAARVDRW